MEGVSFPLPKLELRMGGQKSASAKQTGIAVFLS